MSRLVFDIETNGLLDTVTTIWCIVTQCLETGEKKFYDTNEIEQGCRDLMDADTIVGHNCIQFDIPCLTRFYPWFKPQKVLDTLVISRLLNPERGRDDKFKSSHGGHSVEAFARQFGLSKVAHTDFTVYDANLKERCFSDVEIQTRIYHELKEESKKSDYTFSIKLEHNIQDLVAEQERIGWYVNRDLLKKHIAYLTKRLDAEDTEVLKTIPKRRIKGKTITRIFLKNGDHATPVKMWYRDTYSDSITVPVTPSYKDVGGIFSKVSFEEVNINSSLQVKNYLLSIGWIPTEWNYKKDQFHKPIRQRDGSYLKTTPKITLESLDSVPDSFEGALLKQRFKTSHRLKLLQSIEEAMRSDSRVPQNCVTIGTNTHRMRHKIIANIPKNSEEVFFGKECREIFTAPEGRMLVDVDLCSLEARIIAHYINDPLLTERIVQGSFHTDNINRYGFRDRQTAKNVFFAFIYQASAKRLEAMSGIDGEWLHNELSLDFPQIVEFHNKFEKAKQRKYLIGLDKRLVYFRKEYSIVNTLIQSAGIIAAKLFFVLVWEALREAQKDMKVDSFIVGNAHDELILDTSEKDTKMLENICKAAILKTTDILKLKCPLDVEAKIGKTWAIH